MTIKPSPLHWYSIPGWQTGSLSILKQSGLFRFLLDGVVVFVGYAARHKPGLGGRIAAYRRGDGKAHRATQRIVQLKPRLELQIAFSDDEPWRIRDRCHDIIRREQPSLNAKDPKRGRC